LAALGEGLGAEVLAAQFEEIVGHESNGNGALKGCRNALALQASAKFHKRAGAVPGPGQEFPIEHRALR
jgi:hypothetical protein